MKIRQGNISDIKLWMELVDKVKHIFPGLETKEAMDEHERTVLQFIARKEALCAEVAGKIVGILLFSKELNKICFLAVDSDYRRQHIAFKLVERMYCYLNLAKDITLETHVEGALEGVPARSFYKNLGFKEGVVKEEFGCQVQEFVLAKNIQN